MSSTDRATDQTEEERREAKGGTDVSFAGAHHLRTGKGKYKRRRFNLEERKVGVWEDGKRMGKTDWSKIRGRKRRKREKQANWMKEWGWDKKETKKTSEDQAELITRNSRGKKGK